jgi:hypothetical protein
MVAIWQSGVVSKTSSTGPTLDGWAALLDLERKAAGDPLGLHLVKLATLNGWLALGKRKGWQR